MGPSGLIQRGRETHAQARLAAAIGGLLVVALGGGSLAFGGDSRSGGTSAELIGYSEVPSVSTVARGEFRANIDGG